MQITRGVLFSLFSTLCVWSAFPHPQACDTRILRVSWQVAGGRTLPDLPYFQTTKKGEVDCVAGTKRGGRGRKARNRKGNPLALPFSLLLNPLFRRLHATSSMQEQKTKRILVWFQTEKPLGTRLGKTTSLPLTSGNNWKDPSTAYTIITAISQQTIAKERWSFIAVRLVRSYTEFSREIVVRLALSECILWHSDLFHNPLRYFRYSGCIYPVPLQLWAFWGVELRLLCVHALCYFRVF